VRTQTGVRPGVNPKVKPEGKLLRRRPSLRLRRATGIDRSRATGYIAGKARYAAGLGATDRR